MASGPAIRNFRSLVKARGFITGIPTSITTSAKTLSKVFAGRTFAVNRAAGTTITLPASKGNGDTYRIVVGTLLTSATIVIQVANSSDVMAGGILINDTGDTSAATVDFFPTAASSDTITLTQSIGAGKIGDWVELQDIAANVWAVRGIFAGETDPTNPFSAAV